MKAWYEKPAIVIVLLVFFPPVGLFLAWRFMAWTRQTKLIVTVAASVWFAIMLVGGQNNRRERERVEAARADRENTAAATKKAAPEPTPPDATPAVRLPPPDVEIVREKFLVDRGLMTVNANWRLTNKGSAPVRPGSVCPVLITDGLGCNISEPARFQNMAFTRDPPGKGKKQVITPMALLNRLREEGVILPGGETVLWVKVSLKTVLLKKKCMLRRLKATVSCPGLRSVVVEGWSPTKAKVE